MAKQTVRMVIEVDFDDTEADMPVSPKDWEADPREWGAVSRIEVVEVLS